MPPDAARTGPQRQPIGILAGSGPLPLEVAAAARSSGRPVHIVGIDGFAADAIADYPHSRVNLGQVGGMIGGFRRAGCEEIVIAGGMQRPNLWKLKIDRGFFRAIGTVLKMTRGGDDSILRRIVRFFELQGFSVRGVHEVAPHLVAPVGVLGDVQPRASHDAAIGRGAALIRALGAFDVGQAAVVSAGEVLAVEGARGTDAMLKQVSEQPAGCSSRSEGGAVLVKLPKPGQEIRIDMPVIGPETVERAAQAGLGGIAVAGGRSLVLRRSELLRRATAAGLFVVGLNGTEMDDIASADAPSPDGQAPLAVLGKWAPTPADRRDIMLGRKLMQVLAAHEAGGAAVIAREHVLAINARVPVQAMLAGIGGGSHWGRRAFRKRIGVLIAWHPDVILPQRAAAAEGEPISFDWVAAAGLAGIVCVAGAFSDDEEQEDAIAGANAAGLFLMAPARPA